MIPAPLFTDLQKQAFTLGRAGDTEAIYDALHDAARDAIDELLGDHPEATDDQREALQLEYKSGFWEDTDTRAHKDTRAQLHALAEASRQFQEHVFTLIEHIERHHNTPEAQPLLDAVATASEHLTTQRPALP